MSRSASGVESAALVTVGKCRSIEAEIQKFKSRYPGWLDHGSPVYELPEKVIKSLSKGLAHRPPVLSPSQKLAETDFGKLCSELSAVAVWQGQPIRYRYFGEPVQAPKRSRMRDAGMSDAEIAHAEQKCLYTEDTRLRLKGYVGWLLTSTDFIEERNGLMERWNQFDKGRRPGFPLQRTIRLEQPPSDALEAGTTLCRFQRELTRFLDRWGLLHLITWDLPEPQGPLIPAPMSPGAQSMPHHGLHVVLPTHYPLQDSDAILLEIQRQQIVLARQNGLDASVAGLPHHEVYGQMLEVDHLERVIRSRYAKLSRRAGFVGAMEVALASHIDVCVPHLKRLRKGISACKRGKRESVPWLRRRSGF